MSTAKAKLLAMTAVENGWKGNIKKSSDTVTLVAERNHEKVVVRWVDGKLNRAQYSIFDRKWKLTCQKQVTEKLCGWPDLSNLFKWFPKMNRPTLVEIYRDLPFEFDDPNEEIMAKLIGRKLFWYCRESAKMRCDVVLPPTKSSSKNYRVVNVGHRKMFHFVGAQIGFRSVLLDTIIKVG